MKLKFDSSQEYQLEAIQAVIDVFEGQPINKGDFEISFASNTAGLTFSETGIANNLVISQNQILENVKRIQQKFNEQNTLIDDMGNRKIFPLLMFPKN